MREVIVDSQEKIDLIKAACEKGGHSQIACISNTGLKEGLWRVTILPNSAFNSEQPA